MSWRAITIADVRLTPQETAAMQAIQGSNALGAAILVNVVGEFIDAIENSGNTVVRDGTIPDRIRPAVINRTRWLWLCEFPNLKALQTQAREKLNQEALDLLDAIEAKEVAIIGPDATTAAPANWNSERKIVPRTHGIPAPGVQTTGQGYANPDGPTDSTT